MATIDTAYYVPTLLGLTTTFCIAGGITAACVVEFEIFRNTKYMQCLFNPRSRLTMHRAPILPKRPLAWLTHSFWLDETYFVNRVGLDATMHLRFLRMAAQFLLLQCLVVCPVLLSLHWHRGTVSWQHDLQPMREDALLGHAADEFHSNSTLFLLSMANVPDRQPIVWVHVVLLYFITLSWLWLLFVNHWHHLALLHTVPTTSTIDVMDGDALHGDRDVPAPCAMAMTRMPRSIHHRSVLVTDIPHAMRHPDTLKQHFTNADVGAVESVTLVHQSAAQFLDCALKQRQQWVDRLERQLILAARCINTAKQEENDTDDDLKCFPWPHLVAKMHQHDMTRLIGNMAVWVRDIQLLDSEIERLRQPALCPEYYKPTSTAFITFKSPHSAHICAQAITSGKPGVLDTVLAPEPRDILWPAMLRLGRKDKMVRRVRQCVVFCAVWSLTVFWLFPISFILGLTSIESLSQHFSFLRYFLDTSSLLRSFIQNILPTLMVTFFICLLPWILMEISKQQDFKSYSELEDCVLGRYYRFAIFNVVIVFLLGTSFLSSLLDLLYEPTKITQLLAKSLPQGANFFLNYILFNSATHGMELLQLGSQIFGHLLVTLPFVSNTPRKLLRRTLPWSFPFYYYYPTHILVLVIAITYSVIQPMILIFALFYFSMALLVYRHQYAFCYVRRYETGGTRHYRRMASYTSDGLLIFQLTMVGLLYLKGVLAAATAVLPLLVFSVWMKVWLARLFRQRTKYPFASLFSSPMATANTPVAAATTSTARSSSFIFAVVRWCDDIWKWSFLVSWWRHGRYAAALHNGGSMGDGDQPPNFASWTTVTPAKDDSIDESLDGSTHAEEHEEVAPIIHDDGTNGHDGNEKVQQESAKQHGQRVSSRPRSDAHGAAASHSSSALSPKQEMSEMRIAMPDDASSIEQHMHEWRMHYQDDGCSLYNHYNHPSMLMPLDQRLYLPKNPALWHWELSECIFYTLDDLKQALDQVFDSNLLL